MSDHEILKKYEKMSKRVTVFTQNGYQMRGAIVEIGKYLLVLKTDEGYDVIYKHAISTIR